MTAVGLLPKNIATTDYGFFPDRFFCLMEFWNIMM
jgi:hypothetical protein